MDAAHNRISIPKIALLTLTGALLLATPRLVQAQSFAFPNGSTANLVRSEGAQLAVNSSDGSAITYTATSSAPWVSINGGGSTAAGLTTPGNLSFGLRSTPPSDPASATITLTSTSPAGISGTITVNWTNSSGGGGGGGGGNTQIFANPSQMTLDNSNGPTSTQFILLTTNSTDTFNFTTPANPATWLTVTPTSGSVSGTAPAQLALQFNSANLAAGQVNTNVVITYGSGQQVSVPVTYTIIASTVISTTPSSVNVTTTNSTSVAVSTPSSTFSAFVTNFASTPWIGLTAPGISAAQPSLNGIQTSGGFNVVFYPGATAPAAGTSGTVTVQDASNNSTTLTVTFNGSGGGGSNTVTVTPSPVALNSAVGSGCCSQATVTVSSTISGTMSVSLSSPLNQYVTYQFSNGNTINANGSQSIVLYGNASNLSAQTISGTITVTVNGNSTAQTSAQVNFVIGSGSGGGGGSGNGVNVAPTALTFSADINHVSAISPQVITIADFGNFTASVSATSGGNQWLTLSAANGTSAGASNPALLQVIPNPANLAVGSYSGTVTITSASGTTTVQVNLTVYSSAILYVSAGFGGPGTINVTENNGQIGSVPQLIALTSDGSSMNVTVSTTTPWLILPQTSGGTGTGSGVYPVFFSATSLANGVYVGAVTFTTSAPDSPVTVPVVLTVTGSSTSAALTLSQTSLTLNGVVNGSSVTSSVGVQATSSTSFYGSANGSSNGITWLSVSPTSGTAPQNITVTANPNLLAAGTYTGTVTVNGGGTQAQAQVTFVVSTSGGNQGGNVVSDHPQGLTFTSQVNGSAPATQSLVISNAVSGTAGISFTVSTSVNGGGTNWLSAGVNSINGGNNGTTQSTVVVGVTPGSLGAGSYSGSVTINPSGGNQISIPVSLTIQGAPTVSALPFQLTFNYQSGGTVPSPGQIQVAGSASGLSYSVVANTVSGGNWLAVNKTSGTTPDNLSVTVSPASLAAGSYQGTIVVAGTGSATGSTTISVVLTVTAPFPTITQVLNGATLLNAPVSPGLIVTLKGTAMGPTTPLQTTLDSTGKVSTTLGNVTVLFNGYAAPLLYVSDKQINCVVPYELAQLSSPYVQVRYLGQSSNAFNLQAAATSPGIFTAGTGTGQGAILNPDNSTNGPVGAGTKPAAAGTVVQVYMTGEGQIVPSGVTGKVTCPSSAPCTSLSQIPVPLLVVSALVNNQPATVTFYGEAPSFVSGVLQVNVLIPPNTPSGPVPIAISVGSNRSQSGVTVSVQ